MSTGHARLGPSNHRWPKCPGSVREEAKIKFESGNNEAAIDGTGSHILLEDCLMGDLRADWFIGKTVGATHKDKPEGWMVDKERAARVQMCLDYIDRRKKELGKRIKVSSETRSDPGKYFGRNDWWGTVDVTLFCPSLLSGVLEIIDYKDGRGYVSEKDNTQLISYAGGKLVKYLLKGIDSCPIHTVRMTIVQPKTNPVIRYQEMSVQELWQHVIQLSKAAELTDNPNAPLIAGKHCQWCKAGRTGACPEKTKASLGGIQKMIENGSGTSILENLLTGAKPVTEMSNEELSELKDSFPAINELMKQIDSEIESRLDEGQQVPGYDWGTGNSKKVFVDKDGNELDEAATVKLLKGMRFKKDDIYPPKLISTAAAIKAEHLTDRQRTNLEKYIKVIPGSRKVVRSNQVEKKTATNMFGSTDQPISFM